MRNVYVCEKCNAQFESYAECSNHESNHKQLSISPYNDDYIESLSKYGPEADVPNEIIAGFYKWNDNNKKEYHLFSYRLVKAEPKATKDYIKEIDRRYEEEKARQAKREADEIEMKEQLFDAGVTADEDASYYDLRKLYSLQFNRNFD